MKIYEICAVEIFPVVLCISGVSWLLDILALNFFFGYLNVSTAQHSGGPENNFGKRVEVRLTTDLENLEESENFKETSESQGICDRIPKVR